MGRTKQDVVCEFRTAEILEAARKMFARKGFNGTTVDDIAEAAGLAKGTVYLYFPSKRDIYLAALRQGLTGLIEGTRRAVSAAETPAAKLRAFVSTRLQFAEDNRDLAPILQAEFANLVLPHVGRGFRNLYLEQVRTLRLILEEAMEFGEIRAVRADVAAMMIYDMTRSLVMQRRMGWSKASLEEDLEMLLGLIWDGLGARDTNTGADVSTNAASGSDGNTCG